MEVREGQCSAPDGVRLHYEVHSTPGVAHEAACSTPHRMVFIMGLACGLSGWRWQMEELQAHLTDDGGTPRGAQAAPPAAASADTNNNASCQHETACENAGPPENGTVPRGSSTAAGLQQGASTQPSTSGAQPNCSPHTGRAVQVCLLDNRGVGRSDAPQERHRYSTALMAGDVAAVMVGVP